MIALEPPTVASLPTREQVLPQARRENFTVASAIVGRRRARHLMAIYGFARLVDDVGDESPGDRDALLDLVELELSGVFAEAGAPRPRHPLMQALAVTVRECGLPRPPFERLIEANRVDQVVSRYETFEQLLDYCRLSAAPVGQLVLGIFGAATPERVALSDRVCAGLQVVEHLQDIAEDHRRGRVYIPREDLARFGCGEQDLDSEPPSAPLQALIEFESARARALLSSGAPLARTLPPAPRIAVAGFAAGGLRALDALAPGAPGRLGYARHLVRTVAGR
ncbi:MAG TPA: squalene synthase HpnC [Solirubrobacteraceae bacterium]|nr:squalene synthase HpnC [Solirubrobacteraceae bacterium]